MVSQMNYRPRFLRSHVKNNAYLVALCIIKREFNVLFANEPQCEFTCVLFFISFGFIQKNRISLTVAKF